MDFVSPLPCPYNYGSVHDYIGGEGDYLDAVVLGPRLAAGTRVQVPAWGAVGLSERFMYDDKLICACQMPTVSERAAVLRFFHFYAFCKGMLNVVRGKKGRSRCEGWDTVEAAMGRALPVTSAAVAPRIGY